MTRARSRRRCRRRRVSHFSASNAEVIAAVRSAASVGNGKVVLVGHSWGGLTNRLACRRGGTGFDSVVSLYHQLYATERDVPRCYAGGSEFYRTLSDVWDRSLSIAYVLPRIDVGHRQVARSTLSLRVNSFKALL